MSVLSIESEGGTHVFTLNRPDKRNALSAELVEALIEGVDAAHSAGASTLVFQGAGRNFSAGFDFGDLETQSEGDLLLRFVRIETLLDAVVSSPCLTLGLAHGRNFGAGVDLFAACRWRVAAGDASFRMPGLKFGLVLGTRRFGEIVGAARAFDLLNAAATFDAAQAHAMSFVQRVVEREDWPRLRAEAESQAASLDATSRASLARLLGSHQADGDLAELTRSASRPGLKARIQAYVAAG